MNCKHCKNNLQHIFVDLHFAPPCNAMLSAEELGVGEMYYPLIVYVCDKCFLLQAGEIAKAAEIFNNKYTYFSSFSRSWLAHAQKYVAMIVDRLQLNKESLVLEIASNDGYLLQYFNETGVPAVGVEPSANTAAVALKKGIDTYTEFFNKKFVTDRLLLERKRADLIVGNNVFAHVPDICDFAAAMKMALNKSGTITLEFPHLLRLIEGCQFDTIYHEHYYYLSLYTAQKILRQAKLEIYDVEELPTHGGSLRVYVGHQEEKLEQSQSVENLIGREIQFGLTNLSTYAQFQARIDTKKNELLSFLLEQKRLGKTIAGYGAAGKGNTLLNYCGLKGNDLIRFVVDVNPHKQSMFLPGSHIPVVNEAKLRREKPDFILILPWNIEQEITVQLGYVRDWGCKFVILIPEFKVF